MKSIDASIVKETVRTGSYRHGSCPGNLGVKWLTLGPTKMTVVLGIDELCDLHSTQHVLLVFIFTWTASHPRNFCSTKLKERCDLNEFNVSFHLVEVRFADHSSPHPLHLVWSGRTSCRTTFERNLRLPARCTSFAFSFHAVSPRPGLVKLLALSNFQPSITS